MRILFITWHFPVISETFVLDQITGMIKRGHKVNILARNNPKEDKIHSDFFKYNLKEKLFYLFVPSNPIKRIKHFSFTFFNKFLKGPYNTIDSLNIFKYKTNALSLYNYFIQIMYKNIPEPDIICCHFGTTAKLTYYLKLLWKNRPKLFVIFHSYDVLKFYNKNRRYYKDLFKHIDCSLSINKYWFPYLKSMGCPEDKLKLFYLGVKLEKERIITKSKQNKLNLISVGRLSETKGFENSIRAVARLISIYPKKDITYSIIGDGPLKSKLKKLITHLNMSHKIKLLGPMTSKFVRQRLKESDIFILTSVTTKNGEKEGLPVVLMEAMAESLPVISTSQSGIPELVENNKSGFLVPESNPNAILLKLEEFIKNPQLIKQMGISAREKIKIDFNQDHQLDKLESLFKSIL